MAAARRRAGPGEAPGAGRTADVVPIRRGIAESAATLERDRRLAGAIAAMAAGDARALESLYRETVGRLYGLALRIVRVHEAAEEVTEDAFVQAWRTAGTYAPSRGAPLAWLLTIARSRALDHLRRAEPAIAHPDPERLVAPGEPGLADDPEDLLLACETRGEVARALARLGARDRQLLALAFFRGLSHQEIASHAGLPLGTVKTHIRRSLAMLRESLSAAPRRNDP